jgi:hypothetical protein
MLKPEPNTTPLQTGKPQGMEKPFQPDANVEAAEGSYAPHASPESSVEPPSVNVIKVASSAPPQTANLMPSRSPELIPTASINSVIPATATPQPSHNRVPPPVQSELAAVEREPDVEVRIGKVEVRFDAPPAQLPRQQKSLPSGFADYAARRHYSAHAWRS